MTRGRRRAVITQRRRRRRRGARAGVGRALRRMRHQEGRVLHALDVPDPGRRCRRRRGRRSLLDAERGAPAAAPLVAGTGAPQRAYPAVGAAVAVSAGDAAAAAGRCPYAADRGWHTGEYACSRYTGPGLHLHEAGLIAAPRCVRLLLHLEEARRDQVGMVMVLLMRAAG